MKKKSYGGGHDVDFTGAEEAEPAIRGHDVDFSGIEDQVTATPVVPNVDLSTLDDFDVDQLLALDDASSTLLEHGQWSNF